MELNLIGSRALAEHSKSDVLQWGKAVKLS